MARRLALARCAALGGELLLLDEPFAGVDPEGDILTSQLISKPARGAVTQAEDSAYRRRDRAGR